MDLKSATAMRISAIAAEMARKVIRKEQEKVKKLHESLLEHTNKKPRAQ
jgi:flagellar biosynthesis/type III secretory pathway protein FliH